ncbi:MAG: hypothetical protein F6K16_41380 [Symploca sp. SIO2B6]|nr:hypothetical protein [Symploca sp. SIO2B6]
MAEELKTQREKISQTQTQLRISELERELEQERYEAEEYKLKKKLIFQRSIIVSSIILILGISFFSFELVKKQNRIIKLQDIKDRAARREKREKAMFHVSKSNDLLNFESWIDKREDAALIELVRAAGILLTLENNIEMELDRRRGEKIKVLEAFQDFFEESIDHNEYEEFYFHENFSELSHAELNSMLNDWLRASCENITSTPENTLFFENRLDKNEKNPCYSLSNTSNSLNH